MSKAYSWAMLRECYLKLDTDANTRQLLKEAMATVAPSDVSYPDQGGDSGMVRWDDESYIHWDWDDGQFDLDTKDYYNRLEYPFGKDDPIYWYKHKPEVAEVKTATQGWMDVIKEQ